MNEPFSPLDYLNPNDLLIEITLIIDSLNSSENFTFSYSECNNDIDILIDQLCYMKNIDRLEDMRLVVAPDFIVVDVECIEDGDTVVLKSVEKVQPLDQVTHAQSL